MSNIENRGYSRTAMPVYRGTRGRVMDCKQFDDGSSHTAACSMPIISDARVSLLQFHPIQYHISMHHSERDSYTESSACVSVASASRLQHLRSASTALLQVPRARTTIGRRSFAAAGPSLWNSLPAALRRWEMTLHTFKRQLKAYLFHI